MAKVQKVFVGTYLRIYDTDIELKRFGQLVNVPEEVANHPHLIDPDKFNRLGFTEDELKKYGAVASHGKAPAAFIVKRDAAWAHAQGVPSAPVVDETTSGDAAAEPVEEEGTV